MTRRASISFLRYVLQYVQLSCCIRIRASYKHVFDWLVSFVLKCMLRQIGLSTR